jgi:hypothetical protein
VRFQREQRTREIVLLWQKHERLLVDRDVFGHRDAHLIARLAPEEPDENAALLAKHYISTPRACCQLERELSAPRNTPHGRLPARLVDQKDCRYSLASATDGQLRWVAIPSPDADMVVCTLRTVIGALESYEPALEISERALSRHPRGAVLANEIAIVRGSAYVLNRGLREAVLGAVHRDTLSLSEIALRCGRIKRDRRGGLSGETSWLARRVGLLGAGGGTEPTPWVHTDVLARIARHGLNMQPREVEVAACEPIGKQRARRDRQTLAAG